MTATDTPVKGCPWRCGDDEPAHKHYAVLVRENGKLLGRLTPEGGATSRNIFAMILSKARATEIAGEINAGTNTEIDGLTAKVIPF